jgi:hypothetical protein
VPVWKNLHEYELRWAGQPGRWEPVLYHQGRRVTKAWRLEMDADVAEDPFGGNANTE